MGIALHTFRGIASQSGSTPRTFRVIPEFLQWLESALLAHRDKEIDVQIRQGVATWHSIRTSKPKLRVVRF